MNLNTTDETEVIACDQTQKQQQTGKYDFEVNVSKGKMLFGARFTFTDGNADWSNITKIIVLVDKRDLGAVNISEIIKITLNQVTLVSNPGKC